MATAAAAPTLPAAPQPSSHAAPHQQQQHSHAEVEAYARELASIIAADADDDTARRNASTTSATTPRRSAEDLALRLRLALPGILDVCLTGAAGGKEELRERETERKRQSEIQTNKNN